jgi:hypothetical protein
MLVGSDVSLVDEAAELLTACYSRGALEVRPL